MEISYLTIDKVDERDIRALRSKPKKFWDDFNKIGDGAFKELKKLNKITIPEEIISVGQEAFMDCKNLTDVSMASSGVKTIDMLTFSGCQNLTNITLPEGLTGIGQRAFSGCEILTNIKIPENVATIGISAFRDCESLKEIEIPKWLTTIHDFTFMGCYNLRNVTLPSGLIAIERGAFCKCKSLTEVELPDGLNFIGQNAFYGCENLTKINLPASLTEMDISAFGGCYNLSTAVVPMKVMEIFGKYPYDVFWGGCNFSYIYFNDNEVIFSKEHINDQTYYCVKYDKYVVTRLADDNFRQNYVQLHDMKKQNKIKFIPPDYLLKIFPASQIEQFFIHNNNQRWGRLVKEIGFDKLEGETKDISLGNLLKIYYAIGGFSENQGESEKAYEYIINHVAKAGLGFDDIENVPLDSIAREMDKRFAGIELTGPYNKDFARFFMRYYKDNPNFMDIYVQKHGQKDYLCDAHNMFDKIQRLYPYKVVTGNTERNLLSPRFVAEHCAIKKYSNVNEGNEVLAEMVGMYAYKQEQFEKIQDIYEVAKKEKDKFVIMADRADENDVVKFRLLEKDDPLGFVLGDITNCCQHIDGVGEECVDDGYKNPEAGFLVFEESVRDEKGNKTGETRIIAQAYVWYDSKTKTVCYDNIEIPDKVLDELRGGLKKGNELSIKSLLDAVEKSAESIMRTMNKNGVTVERVTTGEGHNDLIEDIQNRGYVRETDDLASHGDYKGYTDAGEAQYVIKEYDHKTSEYSDAIIQLAEGALKDLLDIKESVIEQKEA